MATDFNKPVVTDAYATLLPGLVTANKDLAMMLEPTLTGTSTNLPTGAVRWNATTVRWERYNGTAWVTLPAAGNNVYAISISGNAATTTALAIARTIGGVSFNGTANINLPGVNTAGNQNTTGNAATATKLATARTVGGVSFDGTANINLPGVNTTGNQNTTGNAATATLATNATTSESCSGNATTATKLATARTINGVGFDGSANITIPSSDVDSIYIYPGGGNAGSPGNIAINSRYVTANPFPGSAIICRVEIRVGGIWGGVGGFIYSSAGGDAGYGVLSQLYNDTIITQTGSAALLAPSSYDGNPFGITANLTASTPCRVAVYKVKG